MRRFSFPPSLLLLGLLVSPALAYIRAGAPVPISPPEYAPVAAATARPFLTSSGERILACAGPVARLDAGGSPLDVPPLWNVAPPTASALAGCHLIVPVDGGWLVPFDVSSFDAEKALEITFVPHEGPPALVGRISGIETSELRLARAGETTAVAYRQDDLPEITVRLFDDELHEHTTVRIEGPTLIDLAANRNGFAFLFPRKIVLTDTGGAVVRTIEVRPELTLTSIVPMGDGFAVAVSRDELFEVSRVSRDLSTLVSLGAIEAPAAPVAIAATEDRVLATWRGGGEVRVARFGTAEPEGPVLVRSYAASPTEAGGAAVTAASDGWVIGWTEGFTWFSRLWPGSLFTLRIGELEPLTAIADSPDAVFLGAASQEARGIARSGDVALAIWSDGELRGALLGSRGARLHPEDLVLPSLYSAGVAGRRDGFLVHGYARDYTAGDARLVAYEVGRTGDVRAGAIELGPLTPADVGLLPHALECTPEVCLAVTMHDDPFGAPEGAAVRVARVADSQVLDPGGVPLAFHQGPGPAIATDGERFLVVWARNFPEGSAIVSASLVDPSGALEYETFDAAVTFHSLQDVDVVWDGATYTIVATARRTAPPVRRTLIRVTREGAVVDGDATAWQGWPLSLSLPGKTTELVTACGDTFVAAHDAWRTELWKLEARDGHQAATFDAALRMAGTACFPSGCFAFVSDDFGDRANAGARAYVVPLGCGRSRLVARP